MRKLLFLLAVLVAALATTATTAGAVVPIQPEDGSGEYVDYGDGYSRPPVLIDNGQVVAVADERAPAQESDATGFDGVAAQVAVEPAPEYGGSAAYAQAAAASALPSCRSYTAYGNVGYIAVQTSPTGYLQWGAYMYNARDNSGHWAVGVFINARKVDGKSQFYAPHGSLPPSTAKPGSVFTLTIVHTYIKWTGWFGFRLAIAYGYLSCIVP
jgi:hypothetical protein